MTANTIIDFDNHCGVLTNIGYSRGFDREYSAVACIVKGKPIAPATITVHIDRWWDEKAALHQGAVNCSFVLDNAEDALTARTTGVLRRSPGSQTSFTRETLCLPAFRLLAKDREI